MFVHHTNLFVLLFLAFGRVATAQSSSSPGGSPPATTPTPAAPPPPPPNGATTLTFTPSVTGSNAVPLASINPNAPQLSDSLHTTFTSNTAIPSAPALPNAASLNPASYPALDKVPPTDSPQVQAWLQEVANSGISVPNISPTVAGGCPANAQAAADQSRCWWTCSGCTRDTDITTCPTKNTWGLTYDDGPSYNTPTLLNYMEAENLKATFFTVGSRVISFPQLAQQEYLGGHQVAVHTWSHPYLTTLTNEQVVAELGWSRQVIKDAIGVTPNTMRPPYGDIDDRVRAISRALGLTPVMWTRLSPTVTFDTGDFDTHAGTTTSEQVLNNWASIVGNASSLSTGFIVLEHDLFPQTVELATGYLLPDALTRGWTIEPVVTCQNKKLSDAYVETSANNSTSSAASSSSGSAAPDRSGSSAQSTGSSSNAAPSSPSSFQALQQYAILLTTFLSTLFFL